MAEEAPVAAMATTARTASSGGARQSIPLDSRRGSFTAEIRAAHTAATSPCHRPSNHTRSMVSPSASSSAPPTSNRIAPSVRS